MKNKLSSILKTFIIIVFFCSLNKIAAQAPNKMSYQAVIRNTSNVLVANQTVGVRVTIVSGSANGTEVYKETFSPNPSTNVNGLLTLEIGTGTPSIGTFNSIAWGTNTFFVKTEIDPTGGTNYSITGTSQLLSVPYAFSAKEATNNWGLNGNTNATTSSFIGTSSSTPIVFKIGQKIAGRLISQGGVNSYNCSYGIDANPLNGGSTNTAVGGLALGQNNITGSADVTGFSNVAVGFAALSNVTSGNNNIGIGATANVASATGSNQVRMGNANISLATIQVAWSVSSDKIWKENIQTSSLGLDFIKDLKPVSYTRKNDESKKTEYGFIAQELETSLNRFDAKNNGIISIDDEGTYSVRYNDLMAPMVKAIQEQQVIIEALKAKIEKLEDEK